MQNAASVLRVSTKKQLNEGEGIENQRRGNTDYIQRRGYRLVSEFVIAESAEGVERQDFEAVIRELIARKAEVDVVIFWKIDRISRGGVVPYYALKGILAKHGIRVEYATEQIDGSPTGELMETLLAGMARFENRLRVERTIGTEKILANDGYWCRAAPTGFRNGRRDGKPVLLPTEVTGQWDLLRYGLRKQLTGMHSAAEVAAELRRKGLLSIRGNPLGQQTWFNICRSPVYGGLIAEAWTGGKVVRAKFNGPLTPDEWVRLQGVLDGRQKVALQAPRKALHPEFPLRRFLMCPNCRRPARGYRTVKPNGDTFDYYDCQKPACGFRVRSTDAHDAFVSLLRRVTPIPPLLDLFREAVLQAWAVKREALEAGKAARVVNMRKLETEKAQLVTLMKRSASKPGLLGNLELDFERVERELSLMKIGDGVAAIDRHDPANVAEACVKALERVDELWEKWPVEAKSRIQRLIFPDGVGYDVLVGSRTPSLSLLYATLGVSRKSKTNMAPPTWRITNEVLEEMVRWHDVLNSQSFAD